MAASVVSVTGKVFDDELTGWHHFVLEYWAGVRRVCEDPRISAIDLEEAELLVDFDGRSVAYPFGELDEVTSAFATAIHNSQGSEYRAMVFPILAQHYTMLRRNLVYTGITRGKRLVGQKKALAMAVRNARGRRSWSKL